MIQTPRPEVINELNEALQASTGVLGKVARAMAGLLFQEVGKVDEAKKWFKKAAKLGDKDVVEFLSQLVDAAKPNAMPMDDMTLEIISSKVQRAKRGKTPIRKSPKGPQAKTIKKRPSENVIESAAAPQKKKGRKHAASKQAQ
jgi:hypothetical protein